MERREAFKWLGGAALGTLFGSAQAADHGHHHHEHAAVAARNTGLIAAASDCQKAGEACLAHCLYLLASGDTAMGGCAQSVNQMLAVCSAMMKLASQDSSLLPAQAKVAAQACEACEKECRKHEKKHAECKACAEACAACFKACQKIAA